MYWLFGYALAWGEKNNLFLGYSNFALSDLPHSANTYLHWFFHFTLAALTCSIVSGALAERTNFTVYTLFTILMSGKRSTPFLKVILYFPGDFCAGQLA